MSQAPEHPTLPQHDNASQQAQRREQLADACQTYVWTTDVATLPGVPLAVSVPLSDQPNVPWLGLVIGVGLAIVRNQIAVKLAGAGTPRTESTRSLDQLRDPDVAAAELARRHAEEAALNRALERCDEIEKSADSIVKQAAAPPARDAAERGLGDDAVTLLQAKLDDLRGLVAQNVVGAVGAVSVSDYEGLFNTLPLPQIASSFQTDATFANLRVAGPNPMLLTGIDKLPASFPVSGEDYRKAMGDGDTLDRALAEGRVYLLDYAELDTLAPGTWQGLSKFPYAPLALFAVPVGGSSLAPVAIQCGQDPASNPIFTPAQDGDGMWGWQIAKTVVQVADGNYHELFAHLARTHLVMEAFAMATRRHLANVHPMWALLIPHFEGSLFINNAAAGSLIAANGPIDHIFAGTIGSTQTAAAADRLGFDFHGRMLPSDLAARRVDDTAKLPDYPYRDDAKLVWQAIHDWAAQYVGIYYESDTDVTGDTELAAWATELAADGKIEGFKAITTRDQLVDVCTMVMFTGSAQHAAVNFPQKDDMTFAPAVTGAGWAAAPTVQAGHTNSEWLGYLPPLTLAIEQLNTLYLLGSVHYRMLGDYASHDFPYGAWFLDPAVTGDALPRFQGALKAVESTILRRNQERRWAYTYLQPSLIPTSINI